MPKMIAKIGTKGINRLRMPEISEATAYIEPSLSASSSDFCLWNIFLPMKDIASKTNQKIIRASMLLMSISDDEDIESAIAK